MSKGLKASKNNSVKISASELMNRHPLPDNRYRSINQSMEQFGKHGSEGSWKAGGPAGPPTALLLCSRFMFLVGILVSHILTHVGQQCPPAPASLGTTHAPCLHGACEMTNRGRLPYPVPEDTAFPPDVPELRGEGQRGSQDRSQPRVGLGRGGRKPGPQGTVWL